MNVETLRSYCLAKSGVAEEFPFGEDTLVFKVMGKAFVLTGISEVPGSCNLKCNPERAEELREKYPAIIPGYHMNKKHWNTVIWDGSISDQFIFELVDHSYNLVIAGLPKNLQVQLLSKEKLNKNASEKIFQRRKLKERKNKK